MKKWKIVADEAMLKKVKKALEGNNFQVEIVETGKLAKEKIFSILPEGAEVMNMTSRTLDAIGVTSEIMESANHRVVKKTLSAMDRKTQYGEMQRLGSAPAWAIGSVHAITEDGSVLIASNTGSQLAGYVYGAQQVIWVVGAQKIVKNIDQGIKRIYEYILPLETVRARKAYGLPDSWSSFVSKLLIYNREPVPNRVKVILVKGPLGF